jgi:hypothetical protein
MRFGSVLSLPVWPFDGPSRQDGVCVVRNANLLACHSIRFSRFKLRQIPCVSCGFARRLPADVRRRQGDTLRTRSECVNGFVGLSFGSGRSADPAHLRAPRTPPEKLSEGVTAERHRTFRWRPRYRFVSRWILVINTRSRVFTASGGAVSYCTSRNTHNQGLRPSTISIPGISSGHRESHGPVGER